MEAALLPDMNSLQAGRRLPKRSPILDGPSPENAVALRGPRVRLANCAVTAQGHDGSGAR